MVAISSSTTHPAAIAAGVGFLLVTGFQVGLALGAPWGRAAWGGSREGLLPRNLRIAGGFAALVLGAGDLRALHPRRLRPLPSSFHPRAVGDLGAVRAVCARRTREPGVEEQVGAAHLEPGVPESWPRCVWSSRAPASQNVPR